MTEQPFVGRHRNDMATALLAAFSSGNIRLYRHPALIRDLKRLTIVEKAYGFKLESTRDASGHADTAIALAMALVHATKRNLYSSSKIGIEGRWIDRPLAPLMQAQFKKFLHPARERRNTISLSQAFAEAELELDLITNPQN